MYDIEQTVQQTMVINIPESHQQTSSEARMTPNAEDQKILTYTDCCERTYLTLLVLLLLNQYPTYRQYASKYSRDTKRTNYNNFRMHSTDPAQLCLFCTG